MRRKIFALILFFIIPFLLFAQKKILLKVELPVGLNHGNNTNIFGGQNINILYPTIYIPLHKHLDIGVSYNKLTSNYYVWEKDPIDLSYKFFKGDLKYNVTSLYFKVNLSASQKRVNPFFSYLLSFTKGKYSSPDRDSTSNYYKRGSDNFFYENFVVGYKGHYMDDIYAYQGRMNSSEEQKTREVLAKSQIAHGFAIGIDYKILPYLNFFIKETMFSVLSPKSSLKEGPFPVYYKEGQNNLNELKGYVASRQLYFMAGILLKIDGGKKTLIK